MAVDLKDPMTSAGNHATAQKYANAAWGWGITGAVCFYFWGWVGALLPAFLTLGAAWESVKATKRALKWEKFEERPSRGQAAPQGAPLTVAIPVDPYQDQLALVRKYGATLHQVAGEELADIKLLPAPKDDLRLALLGCLKRVSAAADQGPLIHAYLSLAMFQPGVQALAKRVPSAEQVAREDDPALLLEYAKQLAGGDWQELMRVSLVEMQGLREELQTAGVA